MKLDTRMTATVQAGVTTNRVQVKRERVKASPRVPARRVKAASAGTALRRYRKDPSTRGLDTAVTCISLPVVELAALDVACEHAQMARSHFIRQAVKHFIEKTKP